MAYKVKGIFKGLKVFSRIFTVKEHEMEIGYPTDVKHVAHIGWDTAAGSASPSWMNDIMASSDLSSSLGNFTALTGSTSTSTSWVSQDLNLQQRVGAVVAENTGRRDDDSATCPDVPRPPRKPVTKQTKDGSSSEPSTSSMDEVVASAPSPAGHVVDAAANAAR